jgi:hypothetical protein
MHWGVLHIMKLWTIQPESVYQDVMSSGVYRCECLNSAVDAHKEQYEWLMGQMKDRVGDPPDGTLQPIWAWYTSNGERAKPDLRRQRWSHGNAGEKYVCMEVEIPEEQVVLLDFISWKIILLDGILSDTKEESCRLEKEYESLDKESSKEMKWKNWERALDITSKNMSRLDSGGSVQAVFWELKEEQIKRVNIFESVAASAPVHAEIE